LASCVALPDPFLDPLPRDIWDCNAAMNNYEIGSRIVGYPQRE
jgi:hypothetical protein